MHADQIGLGDHLAVIGAAPAHPAVGHADDRDPARRCLVDRRSCRVVHRQHADIVAAVEQGRHLGLAQDGHRPARTLEAAMLGNIEDLRQPRIFVAAECRIDDVVGDDARLLRIIADAAQRALGMLARRGDAQTNAIGRHGLGKSLMHQPCSTRKTALPAMRRSRSCGPICARSRQPLSTRCGLTEPSPTRDASSAKSGANRSSASEVK